MNKRLLWMVTLILLATGTFAEAQQPKKVPRIGFLSGSSPSSLASRVESFRQGLRELGYVEGQNIVIEYRYADSKFNRLPELTAELVRLKVDVIVTAGPTGTGPAKEATSAIPIVMAQDPDPLGSGFIASLARPGGNVTGLTDLGPKLGGKRLELLKEAVPKLVRVAVLYDPDNPSSVLSGKEVLPVAASALGLTARLWEVRDASGFERVFAALSKERPHGLYVFGGQLLNNNHKRTAGFALKNRLPSMYVSRYSVDAGGLMYYGADISDSYRRVAYYVDRILKGAKPADLPVEQPTKFELVINFKTAKEIGVAIPPEVLARATKLIK